MMRGWGDRVRALEGVICLEMNFEVVPLFQNLLLQERFIVFKKQDRPGVQAGQYGWRVTTNLLCFWKLLLKILVKVFSHWTCRNVQYTMFTNKFISSLWSLLGPRSVQLTISIDELNIVSTLWGVLIQSQLQIWHYIFRRSNFHLLMADGDPNGWGKSAHIIHKNSMSERVLLRVN